MFGSTQYRYEACKTEAVHLMLFDRDLNETMAVSEDVRE